MKRFISTVSAVFLVVLCGVAAGVDQKDVDIKTRDGFSLRATYY